jgi:hypothetical protein
MSLIGKQIHDKVFNLLTLPLRDLDVAVKRKRC